MTPLYETQPLPSKKGTFPGSVNGTYLNVKVAPGWLDRTFDDPPDLRYSVLYLLPQGSFAWFDYWPGFHYGHHAGTFSRTNGVLHLRGRQSLWCDCPDQNYSGKEFATTLKLYQRQGKRELLGLGDRKHLFIGRGILIPFDGPGGNRFPRTWNELPSWIEGYLGAFEVER